MDLRLRPLLTLGGNLPINNFGGIDTLSGSTRLSGVATVAE